MGEKAGLEIPGESAGHYPSAPPKEGGVGFLAYCGTDVEVTPLQMAAFISTIANGGTLYALQYPRTPDEIAAFQPVVRRRLDNLAEYIPQIHDGLAGSVLYGTGRSAYDPDLPIYGKTGTCSENGARLGWFVSYAGEHPIPICGRGLAARRANDVWPARGGNRRALLSRPDAKGTPHASQPRRFLPDFFPG